MIAVENSYVIGRYFGRKRYVQIVRGLLPGFLPVYPLDQALVALAEARERYRGVALYRVLDSKGRLVLDAKRVA